MVLNLSAGWPDAVNWVASMHAGNRAALARAISILEQGAPDIEPLIAAMEPYLGMAAVYGITGPPGAGKSTLANALIAHWRQSGRTVGVIAVDPSSPVSGGAILGDRIRMTAAQDDDGVFVRSLASRGHLGGLSPEAVRAVDALDASGYDEILIETVGTGQNEIDIAAVADVRVVIAAPGLGDDIQAMKSGLLDIADVVVVNKADRPGAEQTAQQLAGAVSLREMSAEPPRIIKTSALRGDGIGALAAELSRLHVREAASRTPAQRRLRRGRYIVQQAAVAMIRKAVAGDDPRILAMIADVLAGRMRPADAASELLAGHRA